LLPTKAEAVLTLKSPLSVLLADQAERLPDSKPSAKIKSGGVDVGEGTKVAVDVKVGLGVLVGVKVAVGMIVGVKVGVDVNAGVLVGVKVGV
jgi:hypothetical protein